MTPKLYSAIKWGAILGGLLAIFETVTILVAIRNSNCGDATIASCFSMALEALVPLAAGVLAARETGEMRSGLIAGLAAGLVVATINMFTEIVVPIDTALQNCGPADTGAAAVLDVVISRATTLGLGAVFGWVGGRIGHASVQRPPGR